MTTPRRTVVIEDRVYDAAVVRALVDAAPAGLPPDFVAHGLAPEATAEALSALHRDGLLRRDEVDCCHPTSRLATALQISPLP
jgi:hypothetical protein